MKISSLLPRRSVPLLILLFGMGCNVLPEEDGGGSASDYFPLKIGHAWTYALFDSTGHQSGSPTSYRISSTSSSGKTIIYYRDVSTSTSLLEAFYKDDTGVYTVGNEGDLVERRIAYPVIQNKEWEFRAPGVFTDTAGNKVSYLRRAKVEAMESITLFKGLKFDNTLKIHYIVEGPSRPAETLRWYAPGVGMVREVRLFVPNQVTDLTAYYLGPTTAN